MPYYPFYCKDCKKEFTLLMTITEHEKGPTPSCTHCGGKNVVAELPVATVITSKKS